MSKETNASMAQSRRAVDIPLVVVGCDFRNASSSFRGVLVSTPEERKLLHQAITRVDPDAGFMALETCNRVEWIVSTEEPRWMGELLQAQILKRWSRAWPDLRALPTVLNLPGKKGAEHLFRLVSGMESLAAGEAEIAGQFQRALQQAIAEQTTSRILNGIGRFTGGMAKTAHRVGYRSAHARGIHVLAARMLKERLGSGPAQPRVLVVGMGEIGRKCADFAESMLERPVERFNRTVSPRHEGVWKPLSELRASLQEADALILATGAQQPVLDADILEGIVRTRPLLILDIGIPRQASQALAALPQVEVVDVDGLVAVEVRARPTEKEQKLEEEIAAHVDRFRRFCSERHMVQVLRCVQEKRLEMTEGAICRTVAETLGEELSEAAQAKVVNAMRQMVKDYSSDVFESLHSALEEFWSSH